MAGSLQARIKVWSSLEDVTYSDLNAEFDNVLTAMQPLLIDDYSVNTSQMQVTTDPGEVGSESLATTLAGELARLRYMIREITGETQWYTAPEASIATIASAIGTGLTPNRLVSGRVRTTSDQPAFIVPNGSARNVSVIGATTSLVYQIEATQYSIASNVTVSSLTAAPSTNNTCLINDAAAADQDYTKYAGEDGTEIPVDNMGSEITALVGKMAAFSLNNGSATEYFIAEVESTTRLKNARRGYFFDSTEAPVPRIVYSNNDTITLLKLSWLFATTASGVTVTYNPPTYSYDEPSSPSANDYWYDYSTSKWKRYNISAFEDADATLIGVCAQNTTATVAARSFEFFLNYEELNTVSLNFSSNSQLNSRWPSSTINSWGSTYKNEHNHFVWDMATDLESGVTEAASTWYFFYITEDGDEVISNIRPYDRREELRGYYHPYNSWRCVGSAFNNASSNLERVNSYYNRFESLTMSNVVSSNVTVQIVNSMVPLNSFAGNVSITLPPAAMWRGVTLAYVKESNDFNFVTVSAFGSETIKDSTTASNTTITTQGEWVDFISDGTDIYVKHRYIPTKQTSWTPTFSGGSGTVTNIAFEWSRHANKLHGVGRMSTTGAGAITFTLPATTLVVDNSDTTNYKKYGSGRIASVGPYEHGINARGSDNVMSLALGVAGTSNGIAPYTGWSAETHVLDFTVPITGWKG